MKENEIMKRYVKPDAYFTRFTLTDNVAACRPTDITQAAHVDCAIKSGDVDGVFYNVENTPCTYYSTAENTVILGKSSDDDTTYTTYLYWYGPTNGQPNNGSYNSETGVGTGNALMNAIRSALGNHVDAQGLHAGVLTEEVQSVINSTAS